MVDPLDVKKRPEKPTAGNPYGKPKIQRVCGNGEEEEEIIHFYVPEDHSVPLCQLSSLGLLVGPAASSCPETRDGGYRRRETFSPAMSTNFPEPHGVCHNMLRSI